MTILRTIYVRIEYYWKGVSAPPQVAYWHIRPNQLESHVDDDARRNGIVVKAYKTVLGDAVETRQLAYQCDGSKV